MILVEQQNDGWIERYLDNLTGKEWLKYQINSEYHGAGQINLIQLPEPTTTELIEIALTSEFEDEASAAAIRLRDNEQYLDTGFRQELINRLKKIELKQLTDREIQRIRMVISYSELDHIENRREIIGKSYQEIEEDSRFFKSMAEEAYSILKRL
ncbi:hypothetical protein [Sabulibacter ruber]|uniref:hypothetical protein n=1 Tax=Sabulibacter ruber TaxID=2811901 RepID=UPI001A95D909|nr:hypothetical protein [Sabulibacter ruber]